MQLHLLDFRLGFAISSMEAAHVPEETVSSCKFLAIRGTSIDATGTVVAFRTRCLLLAVSTVGAVATALSASVLLYFMLTESGSTAFYTTSFLYFMLTDCGSTAFPTIFPYFMLTEGRSTAFPAMLFPYFMCTECSSTAALAVILQPSMRTHLPRPCSDWRWWRLH